MEEERRRMKEGDMRIREGGEEKGVSVPHLPGLLLRLSELLPRHLWSMVVTGHQWHLCWGTEDLTTSGW